MLSFWTLFRGTITSSSTYMFLYWRRFPGLLSLRRWLNDSSSHKPTIIACIFSFNPLTTRHIYPTLQIIHEIGKAHVNQLIMIRFCNKSSWYHFMWLPLYSLLNIYSFPQYFNCCKYSTSTHRWSADDGENRK